MTAFGMMSILNVSMLGGLLNMNAFTRDGGQTRTLIPYCRRGQDTGLSCAIQIPKNMNTTISHNLEQIKLPNGVIEVEIGQLVAS